MVMVNIVVLEGRLTDDPDIRTTAGGKLVANFTLASNRGKNDPDWLDCVAWENSAEFLRKYGSKGRLILVKGHLQTRSYEDKEGKKRKITEVIVESLKPLDRASETPKTEFSPVDDDIPF